MGMTVAAFKVPANQWSACCPKSDAKT